jgi:GMP synthase-like glutamine amidotransferase
MVTGQEKWRFYIAYKGQLPTKEELKRFKVIVFPGSGRAVYDDKVAWIKDLVEFVQKVYTDYPRIKMIGGCFGA